MSFIYLASPYAHPDPAVMEQRYRIAEAYTALLLKASCHVYSPIVHCHTMAIRYLLPQETGFWRPYNFAMLEMAADLWVLGLDGWEESVGIAEEIEFAREHDIPYTLQFLPPHLYIAA